MRMLKFIFESIAYSLIGIAILLVIILFFIGVYFYIEKITSVFF